MKKVACPLFLLLLLTGFFAKTEESAFEILGQIPVQSGGRVKPFESFAREALLSVTGKFSFEAKSAAALVWEWMAKPEEWHTKSFLPIRFKPLRDEFGLMAIGEKISPELALTHPPFQEKVRQALERQEKKEPVGFLDKKRLELYDRARLFQAVAQGSIPGFLPQPEDPKAGWIPLAGLADLERRAVLEKEYSPSEVAEIQGALARLVRVIREDEKKSLLETANAFRHSLENLLDSRGVLLDQFRLDVERAYYRIRPFQWAWILYLASALSWFVLRGRFASWPLSLFLAGFGMHSLGFIQRSLIAGRPPVSNMYESVIWVAWAAIFFSTVLGLVYRKSILPAVAAWVAAFSLLIGESFPAVLDPSLAPLVPVLRNNYWLTVHVLTITLSYGAFALAWGLAHAVLFVFAFRSKEREKQEMLSQYLYRALQIGVVGLAAGTILGGVWANDSWGRFWGWDPKETWALIALFGYLAVLHGRFAGWLGSFGTAIGSILAFLGILMAWYGVNFVLAAGFHSYGFGGGGLPYVLAALLLDLAFVSFLAFRYNKVR